MSAVEWPASAVQAAAQALFDEAGALPEYGDWHEYEPQARAVLAALSELVTPHGTERAAVVADLNRMADGRQFYRNTPDPQTAPDLDAMDPWERDLWVEVCTWRAAVDLAGGDRDVLYGAHSSTWDDEMVRRLHPWEVAPDAR